MQTQSASGLRLKRLRGGANARPDHQATEAGREQPDEVHHGLVADLGLAAETAEASGSPEQFQTCGGHRLGIQENGPWMR